MDEGSQFASLENNEILKVRTIWLLKLQHHVVVRSELPLRNNSMDIDICPLLEGDRIIPLYTNSLKQSFFFSTIFYKLISGSQKVYITVLSWIKCPLERIWYVLHQAKKIHIFNLIFQSRSKSQKFLAVHWWNIRVI
jgi:hypothetical protein